MKRMVCEMCGSAELLKQDGVFVCQSCGTQYSVEEAKKMMVEIEGTVDVQGTVKVDNSDFVEKYLANARRAISKEDWAEAEKYYNMVEQNDPTNIEAIFYSSYSKAKESLIVEDIYKRQAVFKTLTNSVSILDDNFNIEKTNELLEILERITNDIISMYGSSFVYTKTTKNNITSDNKVETYTLFVELGSEYYSTLYNIASKYSQDRATEKASVLKIALRFLEFLTTSASHLSEESRILNAEKCAVICDMIKKLEPEYVGQDYRALADKMKAEKAKKEKESRIGCIVGAIIFVVVGVGAFLIGYNFLS